MDQNNKISGTQNSLEHSFDVKIMESGTYVTISALQVGCQPNLDVPLPGVGLLSNYTLELKQKGMKT